MITIHVKYKDQDKDIETSCSSISDLEYFRKHYPESEIELFINWAYINNHINCNLLHWIKTKPTDSITQGFITSTFKIRVPNEMQTGEQIVEYLDSQAELILYGGFNALKKHIDRLSGTKKTRKRKIKKEGAPVSIEERADSPII